MTTTRIPFTLRGASGTITVDYGVNEDPGRWGYPLLGLPDDPELARVVLASPGLDEVIDDAAPQIADAGIPWVCWGSQPTFFDAQARLMYGREPT